MIAPSPPCREGYFNFDWTWVCGQTCRPILKTSPEYRLLALGSMGNTCYSKHVNRLQRVNVCRKIGTHLQGFLVRGGSRNFMGGGAQKIMCAHAHLEREERNLLRPGSIGPLKGPGSSWGFWCSLSSLIFSRALFLSILDWYKMWY